MDSFTHGLRAIADERWSKAPRGSRHRFEEAVRDLRGSRLMAEPVRQGEMIPDFSLPNARGEVVCLDALLDRAPVLIGVFPSASAPSCRYIMAAYRRIAQASRGSGSLFAAIAPEPAPASDDTELDTSLLADAEGRVCGLFGAVYTPSAQLVAAFADQGVLAPIATNGRPWLSLLATYVVDRDGIAIFAASDPDPTACARPEELEPVLRGSGTTR